MHKDNSCEIFLPGLSMEGDLVCALFPAGCTYLSVLAAILVTFNISLINEERKSKQMIFKHPEQVI